ncbi:MAG: HAMP domain-containing histidine kinase [Hymenobacter sp.]|nr:MAG: HAMP domain-containing histidine kinase [Hymenobacter sp.]
MATKQYSKRFVAGLQRSYLLAVPAMLVCVLLANNYFYDAYYDYIYPRRFRQTVAAVDRYWQHHGHLPTLPHVRYRRLPPGTAPYAYLTDRYAQQNPALNATHYTATLARGAAQVEVTVESLGPANAVPGNELVLCSVALSLGLFLGLSWLLFRFTSRRLSYRLWAPFYQNLRRINAFNLRDRQPLALTPTDIREFAFFNEAIGHFTGKIQQSYNELREFTENTAHELQTPLAVLLAKTELVLKRDRLESADRQELLEIKKTVLRLSSLQKALNLLSRVRALHYGGALALEPLNATELLREVLENYEELLHYKQLHIQWPQEQPWLLHSNRELLGILLDNLVRNAIQHNVPGGTIRLETQVAGLVLRNTGPVPTQPATDLFRRYHTRSTDDGRLGLGLALVEAISAVLHLRCSYQYTDGEHAFALGV